MREKSKKIKLLLIGLIVSQLSFGAPAVTIGNATTAVGDESRATVDYATAVGHKSKAE